MDNFLMVGGIYKHKDSTTLSVMLEQLKKLKLRLTTELGIVFIN